MVTKGNKTVPSLFSILSMIEDKRDNRGKRHDLTEILMLTIIGFLMGKTDFVNMVHCFKLQENHLKQRMTLKNGIPSHDTFSRIMRTIDDDDLIFAITDWFYGLIENVGGKHLIIDGKGIRAATKKNKNKKTPYILNVIEEGSKLVLMQRKIDEKTNEIGGIPELLDYIYLKDAVITIDAIGTQRPIIQKITQKGGHFVLPVKENNENLKSDIELYLDDLSKSKDDRLQTLVSYERGHGRAEKRSYYFISGNDCIDEKDILKNIVKGVGMVKRERTEIVYDDEGNIKNNKTSVQIIHYITDLNLSVNDFKNYVLKHWTIENSLHWVLDNTLKEDRATHKVDNAMQNVALMRKVAYNILRLHQRTLQDHSMEYIIDELRYDLSTMMRYLFSTIDI